MAIGRTDERDTPCHPTAPCDAADVLRARSRNPSGPRSYQPHRKAGHMTALVPVAGFLRRCPLNPQGRPHMTALVPVAGFLRRCPLNPQGRPHMDGGTNNDVSDTSGRLLSCGLGQRESDPAVMQMARRQMSWDHLTQGGHLVAAARHDVGTALVKVA